MQFRLTYSGPLQSSGNDSASRRRKRSDHKHDLRKAFHPQLKRLWELTPHLKNGHRSGPSVLVLSGDQAGEKSPVYKAGYLAKKHKVSDWSFVPLVTADLNLVCSIDILFLRPQAPGGVVRHGDLDGRLKTLLDALSVPDEQQGYGDRDQDAGESRFYVLLQDDKLVTKISVETDQLLEIVGSKDSHNDVRLVININLRPYEMHLGNMQFG